MSREIKCRAWDNVNKEMYEVGYIDFANKKVQLAIVNDQVCYKQFVTDLKDVELLQYTGLKDSKGNGIFEGDILKVPSINDHVHGNYSYKEVIYRNGTWIAQYIKSEKGQVVPRGYIAGHLIDCYDHDYKALAFYDDRLEHTDIEIVGNIYENPELLKGGN